MQLLTQFCLNFPSVHQDRWVSSRFPWVTEAEGGGKEEASVRTAPVQVAEEGMLGSPGSRACATVAKTQVSKMGLHFASFPMNNSSSRLYPALPHKSLRPLERPPTHDKTTEPALGNLRSVVKNSVSDLCPWSGLSTQWKIVCCGFVVVVVVAVVWGFFGLGFAVVEQDLNFIKHSYIIACFKDPAIHL